MQTVKIIKGGVVGFLGGCFYAFVSFYLIIHYMKKYLLQQVIAFGIVGLILGISYASLKGIYNKIKVQSGSNLIGNIIIGIISGFLSSCFNIIVNYEVLTAPYITNELKTDTILSLVQFTIGSVLIGLVIGLLLGLWEQKDQRTS